MEKIVVPYLFEKSLLLAIDNKWKNLFGGELSFRVFVNKEQRLCIVSEQCLKK